MLEKITELARLKYKFLDEEKGLNMTCIKQNIIHNYYAASLLNEIMEHETWFLKRNHFIIVRACNLM